ncbi:MAG TPA: hypothetical protein VHE36_10590 [Sphingomicrobium sp.]|nr:hypothetical protein [Sphingomicrobium sp.]
MKKAVLAFCAAAVALTVAAPADARRTGPVTCAKWRHGHCVKWRSRYNVGYAFGPRYRYVDVRALPGPIVTRYRLGHNYRYVNENGYIYVVNPRTYRVVRVIPTF